MEEMQPSQTMIKPISYDFIGSYQAELYVCTTKKEIAD